MIYKCLCYFYTFWNCRQASCFVMVNNKLLHLSVTSTAGQSPVGQSLLIINASQWHSDTTHTVRLLWTKDQPDAETSTWKTNNTHIRPVSSGVPRNFVRRGGSTNSVENRGHRERGSGGGSPLVRGSGCSCNLVQENFISYSKIFLIFGTLDYLWWQPIYLSLLM